MKKALFIFIGIVILAGSFLAWDVWKCENDWCFLFEWQKIRAADSFERCVGLGFPIIKVYPPECRAGDKSFPEGSTKSGDSGDAHDIPTPKAVTDAVRNAVAERLKLSEWEVTILTAYEKEWPNSCLGLAPTAYGCVETVTPGYEVTVRAGNQRFVYRTNNNGSIVKPQ